MRKLAPALIACLGLAACGTHPPEVPDVAETPATPTTYTNFTSPSRDVRFKHPDNWPLVPRPAPGVATVASGGASVTVWAYAATSPVVDNAQAQAALGRLLASLKRRDPGFRVTQAGLTTGYEGPAVQIEGATKIRGRPVRVRSVHVWVGAGEYVIDALAAPEAFQFAERAAFQPLLKSLRLGGQPTGAAPPTPTTPTGPTTTTPTTTTPTSTTPTTTTPTPTAPSRTPSPAVPPSFPTPND